MTKTKETVVPFKYTKIKSLDNGNTIDLKWLHPKNSTTDKGSLESQDKPLPGFDKALENLKGHIQEIMALSAAWVKTVRVLGVSLDYKNGIMGAVITFRKEDLAGGKGTTINTPHYSEAPYQEGAPEVNLLPAQCVIDIQELIAQAENYRKGNRAQIDAFPGGKPGAGESPTKKRGIAGRDDVPE